jgi:hypothetical protein
MSDIDYELQQSQQEYYSPDQMVKPFERDQDIAQHLLSTAKYKGKAVNEDSTRANNNPDELKASRCAGRLINRLELGAKIYGWEFSNLIDFFEQDRAIIDVPSRGKHGWVSTLTKSNINIQQAEQISERIATDFGEQAQQSLQDKIRSKLPFLRKQELY